MDLPDVKFHIQELYSLLIQEPNNPIFAQLCVSLETELNSSPLKEVKPSIFIPVSILQAERKRRQATEKLIKNLQENPAYPDEVKADIAKRFQETIQKHRKQMRENDT